MPCPSPVCSVDRDSVAAGGGLFQVFITTVLVNFRFSFLGAALSPYLRETRKIWLPFLSFGIVTPTFGQIIARGQQYGKIEAYMFSIQITFVIWWVLGGVVGYLMPGILPLSLQQVLSFAFPAVLIGMIVNLVPVQKSFFKVMTDYSVGLIAGLLALALYFLSPTWSVPLAAVIGATIGTLVKWKQH